MQDSKKETSYLSEDWIVAITGTPQKFKIVSALGGS